MTSAVAETPSSAWCHRSAFETTFTVCAQSQQRRGRLSPSLPGAAPAALTPLPLPGGCWVYPWGWGQASCHQLGGGASLCCSPGTRWGPGYGPLITLELC